MLSCQKITLCIMLTLVQSYQLFQTPFNNAGLKIDGPSQQKVDLQSKNEQISLEIDNNQSPELSRPQGQSHPYRLTPSYTQTIRKSKEFKTVRTAFEIGALFYSKVLKVQYLDQSQVYFKKQFSYICPIIPQKYIKQGFDQNQTDTLVGVGHLKPEDAEDTIAMAAHCIVTRRVTYGAIYFNLSTIKPSFLSAHTLIITTIHEMTHMLGFSDLLYPFYYTNSTSTTRKHLSEIIKKADGLLYIVSPKVMEYLEGFYNCYDGPGALLYPSDQSHWDPFIFNEQLMTPKWMKAGKKITKLTLALLEDTGFYSQVDYKWSQKTTWGYKKGCSFLRLKNPNDFDCNSFTCDETGRYAQLCYTDIYNRPVDGQVCEDQQNKGFDQPPYVKLITNFQYFGFRSRCFDSLLKGTTYCFKAFCSWDNRIVTINVRNKTGFCYKPYNGVRKTIEINGVVLRCPSNFQAFCNYRGCPKFCSGKGLCLQGECLCAPGYRGDDCSLVL